MLLSNIRKRIWIVCFVIGNTSYCNGYQRKHPGESMFLPDERTSLDDCHLRYYKFKKSGFSLEAGVGALPARQFDFAHLGAIGWIQQRNSNIVWLCEGSLIWDNFVLAAAHCVVDASNTPPDVVRFGDSDLFSSVGDEFAQQLKIAEIIQHPNHTLPGHNHNIALLRLEKSVRINVAVTPACLWLDKEVWFKRVHGTRRSKVRNDGNQSSVLLKMEVIPISRQECSKVYSNGTTRKLSQGLVDQNICVFNPKTETCEGEFGGPLQVNLMHNMRQTPFIIGVPSFGLICGMSSPGVYTRVASYHQWIIDTMRERGAAVDENTYNSSTCAHRYAKYREFYDGVVVHRDSNRLVRFDVSNYMFEFPFSAVPWDLAKLGWSSGSDPGNCYGVIVDEDTVLTVADCAESNGIPVDQIVHPTVVNISTINIHPRYKKGSIYYNIAVLKLKSLLSFKAELGVAPACIWVEREWPFRDAFVLGKGQTNLVEPLYPNEDVDLDSSSGLLTLKNVIRNNSSCAVGDRELSRMKNGTAEEHVCAGFDSYIVPEMCNLLIGAAVEQTMTREDREYKFTLALSQFGRDCGFGHHMIATRLASHVEWLNSILLPNHRDFASSVHIVDPDLNEDDSCEVSSTRSGKCVMISECSHYWQQLVALGQVMFCSTTNVICCPTTDPESPFLKSEETELERCPSMMEDFQYQKAWDASENASIVHIGFDTDDWYDFRCLGSIITAEHILTTASCFRDDIPSVVQLSDGETIVPIQSIITRNDYNATDKANDVAIIELAGILRWGPYLFPICLWMNQTHTPLVMRLIELDGDSNTQTQTNKFMIPQYNTDCQREHPFQLQRSQLCAREPDHRNTCAKAGDLLQWDGLYRSPYLVGLAQPSENCNSRSYITFTRISQQIEWIKQALYHSDY